MKRKVIAIFMFVFLLFGLAFSSVFAKNVEQTEDFTYENSFRIDTIRRHRSHSSRKISDYNSIEEGIFYEIVVPLIIVVIAVGVILFKKYISNNIHDNSAAERMLNKKINNQNVDDLWTLPKNFTQQITSEIRKKDSSFSANKFIWLVENYFIAYMDAYSDRNIELLEMLTTPDIYFDDKNIIEEQIQNGVAHIRKNITFHTDYLYKYEYSSKYEYVTAYIKVKMIDYMAIVKTGESYKGSKTTDKFMHYTITLRRKMGEKTVVNEDVRTISCPNCGAMMDFVISGKCPFCGKSSVVTEEHWRISSLREANITADFGAAGIFEIY